MDEYLVSIIVPAYNIESYLPRCLESLRCQTHQTLEIIVVNDGSQDGTGAIIDEFATRDSRIVAIHKKNGGVTSARMEGIAASHGEYVGFVDGDDYVEPEMFAHLLKNALENNAEISHCGYQMVYPDGHIDYYYNTGRLVEQDKIEGMKDLLTGSFVEPGLVNKLFQKKLFHDLLNDEVLPVDIKINEDLLMNYWLFKNSKKSIYEDIPYYHYMLRKGSAATSKPKKFKVTDPIKVMQIILHDSKDVMQVYCIAAERYLRVLISATQQKEWPEEAQKAKYEIIAKLKEFRMLSGISAKVRLMAIGVVYMNPVYKLVRKVYNLFTNVDKKYDLE